VTGIDSQIELPRRGRLLITAYHYDRYFSMESRLSWHRAHQAASEYEVTVICARDEETLAAPSTGENGRAVRPVEIVRLAIDLAERSLMATRATYYAGYRRWLRRAGRLAAKMHTERPFALVHHVSFCGFREPSEGWRLGAPFIWGPLGGTPMFPRAFLGQLDATGAAREVVRNFFNRRQLTSNRRVQRAWNAAAAVLAANREVARDLRAAFGEPAAVQLETGIEAVRSTPRPRRDPGQPLKIIWPGRLRSWKALPLLLHAVAKAPNRDAFTLRVLGEGPCRGRWERLARRLGLGAHVEWVGWPEYPGQLEHYEWADVMAFTSLRDTSGTGLLEALAGGAPIVGVDHQGAADVMTDECAIRIPVTTPESTIAAFRAALVRLAGDGELLHQLSQGAMERAREFSWARQWEQTREIYRAAEGRSASATPRASIAEAASTDRRVRRLPAHSEVQAARKASC